MTSSRANVLAFSTAFVVLATQVLVHRLVQAKLVSNFAFLVLSLTMLGFALSSVVLTRWQQVLLERADDVIVVSSALFVLSLLAVSWGFCHAPVAENSNRLDRVVVLLNLVRCVPLALLFAIPFGWCGVILGLLLSSPGLSTRRIYAFDLVGSALGAFLVVPAISYIGVEASLLVVAAGLLGICWLILLPRRPLTRMAAGAAALSLVLSGAAIRPMFRMSYASQSPLGATQDPGSGYVLEHIAWDPVARIEVTRVPPPTPGTSAWPSLIGTKPEFLALFQKLLTQNNNAFTYAVAYDGQRSSLDGIEDTLYAAAYHATSVPRPRVLIVGVGGGFDVLTALHADAPEITGVEINAATVRILRRSYEPYFRHWVSDPRVRLVNAEGRSFLERSPGQMDIIELSGVDTASGTPGAAHVFSENYLYTSEAFDLYLSKLGDEGMLDMMRPEYTPPREMLRALVTATAALRRSGISNPARHVIVICSTDRMLTSMLVKKTPFRVEEVERVARWCVRNRLIFFAAAAPFARAMPDNPYQLFLSLGTPELEQRFVASYPFDVSPLSDDRPFFFHYSRWSHLWSPDPAIQASVPVMEYTLLLLLALTTLAAVVGIYAPLRLLVRLAERRQTGTLMRAIYFGGIGLGYLAVEMGLLQKFGLFLGHPNYALSVVLPALLVASGVGSFASATLVRLVGGIRFIGYTFAACMLGEYFLAFPRLHGLLALPFPLRVAMVFALVFPVGLCLGVYFPYGLDRLKQTASAYAPWAWGLNGVFSVLSPILSVSLSMTWGIGALLISTIPVYLLVGLAAAYGDTSRA
jgi:hypothetical protein